MNGILHLTLDWHSGKRKLTLVQEGDIPKLRDKQLAIAISASQHTSETEDDNEAEYGRLVADDPVIITEQIERFVNTLKGALGPVATPVPANICGGTTDHSSPGPRGRVLASMGWPTRRGTPASLGKTWG